jgi:hypothetical protein
MPNFKTKKALREALQRGDHIEVFQPYLGSVPQQGTISLEGPHYPQPHTWYAEGVMLGGKLAKIR